MPRHLTSDAHVDLRYSYCPYLLSSDPTANDRLGIISGKEALVELDSSLA